MACLFSLPSLLTIAFMMSCCLRPALSDTAFNQTVLRVFNTSSPAISQASQLAFDTRRRQLLLADLGNTRLLSFSTTTDASFSVIADSDTLSYAKAVAVADDGTVWAGETGSLGVLQLQMSSVGATVLQNITGTQLGTSSISAVAIDSASGALFASDAFSGRVVQIDPTSGGVKHLYTSPTNSTWQPWGIAINSGYLYVGDCTSGLLMKLSVDSGALVRQYDVRSGFQFPGYPVGVAFDSVGNIFVADSLRVWKIDAVSGLLLAMWNASTTSVRNFSPDSLALDSGLLYISSYDSVLVFSDLTDGQPANVAQLSAHPGAAIFVLAVACHAIQLFVCAM